MTRTLAGMLLLATAFAGGCRQASVGPSHRVQGVSAVAGESLLKQHGLEIAETALGQRGGSEPAPETARREAIPHIVGRTSLVDYLWSPFSRPSSGSGSVEPDSPETFLLAGADVYRLSCQACHGPDGVGGPPDIGSLVGPVQGTSLVWLTQRMLERGRPVDEGFLQSVSLDAARDLRDRIREGGEKMPPFGHLQRDEIDVLLNYLERLAQLPDAGPDRLIDVPSVRAGELLVKGTCHICHDATGPGGRTMMMTGAIPSLASFGTPRAFGATVAKVRTGSSGFMMMPMMRPSRMPIFPYLTPEEVAAAIVFLTAYPPQAAR